MNVATTGESSTGDAHENRGAIRLSTLRKTGLLTADADEALDRLTALAASLLELPHVFISLVGEERELIKSHAGPDSRFEADDIIPLDESFARHVIASGEPVVIEETARDERVSESPMRENYQIGAYAAFPIVDDEGDVLGTFVGADPNSREWSDRELDVLADLAAFASTDIQLRVAAEDRNRLETKLQRESMYDSLTGLVSRDLFVDRLAHALERAERTGAALAVLFLDLDDFRRVNVDLGRSAGDEVLVRTAARLESESRDQDTIGRLGRDQFAIILENVDDRDQIAQIASRLHQSIAQPVELDDGDVECGASIGYLLTSPDDDPYGIPTSTDPDKLLHLSERTMHAAKDRGVPYLNAAEAQVTT